MRKHPARSLGTPDLDHSDLAGTAFLLQAEGRLPEGADPLCCARHAHRFARIDRDRRGAGRPRGIAYRRLRAGLLNGAAGDNVKEPGPGFVVPVEGPDHEIEVRDEVAFLLRSLTPAEATLLRWRAEGTPILAIAERLGSAPRTVEARWTALRARAQALLNL